MYSLAMLVLLRGLPLLNVLQSRLTRSYTLVASFCCCRFTAVSNLRYMGPNGLVDGLSSFR